jgi:alcohol dehydrogenase (cytochrome c)
LRTPPLFARTAALAGLVALGATLAPASAAKQDGDWPVYNQTVDGHRYSTLTGVNATNVGRLQVTWSKQLGPPVSMEGTPLVKDGRMYVTTGFGQLYALDAVTGAVKWTYSYEKGEQGKPCCNRDVRGVTLTEDAVILPTVDAHLIALDQKTGAVRWSTSVVKWADGYSITSPPLYVDGLIVTGMSGGEYPTRGFLAGYDPKTGKEVWRTYTVPTKTDPEYKTWEIAPGHSPFGAPTWVTGTYDPQLDTIYWGTGNPNPDFDPSAFAGTDLLYSDSLLAIDPHTGKIKWHYKWTPRNFYDYDGVNEAVLADLPIDGKIVKALVHADRNGYMFVLDRTNGKVIYVEPFVDKVTWAQIDRTTGVVHLNPEIQAKAAAMQPVEFWPSGTGGKNWQPSAYDPVKHIYVIPALESSGMLHPSKTPDDPEPGVRNTGTFMTITAPYHGSVVAYDLTTGKQLWKVHTNTPQIGGVMIAGGLVFDSELEGTIAVYDEQTGKLVWRSPKLGNGGLSAPPMTYSVNGTQYVAVEVGIGGIWAKKLPKDVPGLEAVKPDSAIYVFALKK